MITNVDGQNEMLQSLRKQLEATERDLADRKWLLDRFLESPWWRMTYPIRWVAKQARRLRTWAPSPSGRGRRDSRQADATGEGLERGGSQVLRPSPCPLPEG